MKRLGLASISVAGLAGMAILGVSGLAAGQAPGAAPRKLAPLTYGPPPAQASAKETTEAARALMAGKPEEAIKHADQALAAQPKSAWAHYQKASALAALGKWEAAVSEYDEAMRTFARGDDWGRSVALWGRGEVLRDSGHCDEAKTTFNEYVSLVASRDKKAADLANEQSAACKAPAERKAEAVAANQAAPEPVAPAKEEEATAAKPVLETPARKAMELPSAGKP
jgi:tetratricopeptide (TPR) repeat protein